MANLSIKGARDDVVERLKERAERNHRSLNGELLAIIEAAVADRPLSTEDEATKGGHRLTVGDVLAAARESGLKSPSESAAIVRAMRDGRYGR